RLHASVSASSEKIGGVPEGLPARRACTLPLATQHQICRYLQGRRTPSQAARTVWRCLARDPGPPSSWVARAGTPPLCHFQDFGAFSTDHRQIAPLIEPLPIMAGLLSPGEFDGKLMLFQNIQQCTLSMGFPTGPPCELRLFTGLWLFF